jgi:2-polyprenyl-3-methyl-5-hydroxy-6-metoxy-1,4-benzoquinol methylase
VREEEIRPKHLREEFLRLSKEDIKIFFGDNKERVYCPCPACGEEANFLFQFNKHGFDYVECTKCETLFVNPRPKEKDIDNYYTNSKAAKYWSTHLFKETEQSRRKHIFAPKAKMVLGLLEEIGNKEHHRSLLDVGMGYGIFAEEISKLGYFNTVVGIEPSPSLAVVCKKKGFEVIRLPVEKVDSAGEMFSVAVSFEVIEHVASPKKFVTAIGRLLMKGGCIILSTLNLHGFELLSLWDKSESVFPPHHINFFNPNSLSLLLERCGFHVIRAFTPGKLDVDIVMNHIDLIQENRFLRYLLTKTHDEVKGNFQAFLKKNNLSSHMWVVGQKIR